MAHSGATTRPKAPGPRRGKGGTTPTPAVGYGPWSCALEAGRYLNATGWHLRVARLLRASDHAVSELHYCVYHDVKRRLIDSLRRYVPVKERQRLERSIEEGLESSESFYGSEDHTASSWCGLSLIA